MPVRGGPIAVLILLLMTVGYFRPLLMGRGVLYRGDFNNLFYPSKLMVAKALTQWRLPAWDPSQMGGIPLLAHPFSAAAYPPSLITALLPFNVGVGVFIALHYLLAGLFTYYLLREFGVSAAAGLVAAVSFSFGGVMVSSAVSPPLLQTFTWFPLLALFFRRAVDRASGVYLVLSTLAFALMFYGGELYLAYMATMILFFWAASETAHHIRADTGAQGSQWPPIAFVVTVLIGFLLTLPLLLSTGVFTSLSTGAAGIGLETASKLSLRPGGLLGLISPSLFFDQLSNTPWCGNAGACGESRFLSLYVGAIPLSLSLLGIAYAGRRLRWLFLAPLLVFLTAAMGKDLLVFPFIHKYIPFMNMFRDPEKLTVFAVFFIAVFAGLGADRVLCWSSGETSNPEQGRREKIMPLRWLFPWVIAIGAVWAMAAVFRRQFTQFIDWAGIFNAPLSSYPAYRSALMTDLIRFAGFVTVLMIFALVARRSRRGKLYLGIALVLLTALDLFTAHYRLNGITPEGYYLEPPAVAREMENEDQPYRIHSLIFEGNNAPPPYSFSGAQGFHLWEKEALRPNLGAVFGLQYAAGESGEGLSLQQYFMDRVINAPPGIKEKLLGIYNVKYMIALPGRKDESAGGDSDLELVGRFEKQGVLLYRNKRYLPRVYRVPSARYAGTNKQALSLMQREDFDPRKEVVLAVERVMKESLPGELSRSEPEPTEGPGYPFPKIKAGLDLLEYTDSLVSVGVNYDRGGYLVISDAYYPGWEATIDGRPVDILRANLLFRAVELPAGTHFVRFTYTPYAFLKGVYTGFPMAALGMTLILAFYFASRRKAAAPGEKPRDAIVPPEKGAPMDTLNRLFEATCEKHGGKIAVTFDRQSFTFAELNSVSNRLAQLLADQGVAHGDRVALRLPKCTEFIFCYLANLKLGVVTLPLNPAYSRDELAYFLSDSGTSLLVTDYASRDTIDTIRRSLPDLRRVIYYDHPEGGVMRRARAFPDHAPATTVSPRDIALICYTSGTTGRPKGAMLSHKNMVANIESLIQAWGLTADDRFLHTLPLFHMHGLGVGLHGAIAAGYYTLMHERFDPEKVMSALEREKMTLFMGVPTFYHRFLGLPQEREYDLTSMRLFVSGSAPLREDTFNGFGKRFGHTILERYGMTETGMNISNPLRGERRPGTVGLPLPGVRVRIVDPEIGAVLPAGEVGEIQLRGDNVFSGYWRKPRETEESFTDDGWFHTGDLGVRDGDGYYSIVGRAKDLIISGGLNVYPKEVERVINEHPAVAESAVVGLPDPDLGEKVVAFVVRGDDAVVDSEEIIAFCAESLAGYKKPKEVFFIKELPRNAMGKVLKGELKKGT